MKVVQMAMLAAKKVVMTVLMKAVQMVSSWARMKVATTALRTVGN